LATSSRTAATAAFVLCDSASIWMALGMLLLGGATPAMPHTTHHHCPQLLLNLESVFTFGSILKLFVVERVIVKGS